MGELMHFCQVRENCSTVLYREIIGIYIVKLSSLQDCELSFEEGDMLFITDRSDPTWWQAILDNKKGYVRSDHGQLPSLSLSPSPNF